MERVSDEARGRGNQASFKIFCQLTLQLHPNFNIKALEAFVTPKVVGRAINEVEEKVASLKAVELVEDLGCS